MIMILNLLSLEDFLTKNKSDLQYFMNDKVTLMEHLRQNIELLKISSQYLIIINNHMTEDTYKLVLKNIRRNDGPKPAEDFYSKKFV